MIYGINYLRGLAVGIVLLFHLKVFDNIYFLPGGFLGVDIFFVISGYILTSIFLKNKINLTQFISFYERRARRILPMYLLVIILTTFASNEFFTNVNFSNTLETVKYSLMSISNYYFINNGIGYGEDASNFYPLLHLWSLSIEMHFYFLLPIILFFTKNDSKFLLILVTFLIVVSVSFAIYLEHTNFKASYYSTLARFWQPLLGLLLAVIQKFNLIGNERETLRQPFYMLIFSGLFISCIAFSSELEIGRIYYSIIICISTIIFINKATSSNKEYSFLIPIGYLGLISYSTYLWHFPIYTIMNFVYLDSLEEFKPYISIVATLFISSITYYFVEKFFQNRKIFPSFVLLILIFISLGGIIHTVSKFESEILDRVEPYPIVTDDWNIRNDQYLKEWNNFRVEEYPPLFSNKHREKFNVLIVGNSHAADTFHMFHLNKDLFPRYTFSILRGIDSLGWKNYQPECLISLIQDRSPFCKDAEGNNVEFWQALHLYDNADIIMFSAQWHGERFDQIEKAVSLAAQDDKKVVLLGNTVQVQPIKDPVSNIEFNLLDYFIVKNKYFPNESELNDIEHKQYLQAKLSSNIDKAIMEMAMRNNVYYLDKKYLFCNKAQQTCITTTREQKKNLKLSWDYGHLTLDGAKYMGRKAKSIQFLSSILDEKPTYDLFFK